MLDGINQIADCLCSYVRLESHPDIGVGIDELRQLYEYAFYREKNELLTKNYVSRIVYEEIRYPLRIEHKVIEQIRSSDLDAMQKTCDEFVKQVIESKGRQNEIKDYTVKFVSTVYETIQRYGIMGKTENPIQYYFKLMLDSQTREELLKYFYKAIHSSSDTGREQLETENLIILKVISYIRNNYQYDITLSDAADYVGITPIYLSKLFAKEMNINFVAFLRDFRISAAKRMLAANKYKIGEIAEKVGFKDPKYFNKVFKAVCGISPSEYKRGGGV